jgi:hypothetical protein
MSRHRTRFTPNLSRGLVKPVQLKLRQLTFESRQLMQATFRLTLVSGEPGACAVSGPGPGPDVDAGDSSEDGVGAIELKLCQRLFSLF